VLCQTSWWPLQFQILTNWILAGSLKFALWKKTILWYINPFLFIRGLSCPSCIQASLSLNFLKLTILGFPHNCLPLSCGDNWLLKKIQCLVLAWKSGLKVSFLPFGCSCPLQTILLRDLIVCDCPLQIVMAFWHTILFSRGLSLQTKRAPNCHFFLQRAVTPHWRGIIARVEELSDDINSHLFLMNKKELKEAHEWNRTFNKTQIFSK